MKNHLSLLLFGSIASFSTTTYAKDVCHALVMSGGGSKGAYEAGFLYGLAHSNQSIDVTWDVVSGVSAGSINAAFISLFEIGNEKEMTEKQLDLFNNMTNHQVWKEWDDGLVAGLFNHTGFLDDSPLYNMINDIVMEAGSIKKKMVVAAADSQDGSYILFTEQLPFEDIPTAVVASGSMPMIFPTRDFQGHILMDGGTIWNANLVSAVNRCLEIVDDPSKIVMDIAICQNAKLDDLTTVSNTVGNWLRYREIKSYYKSLDDIIEFMKTQPTVNYRYLAVPSEKLEPSYDEIIFTPNNIPPMIEQGKADAELIIAMGEGTSFDALRAWD